MAAQHRPTDEDRRRVIDIALSGVARRDNLADVAARLEPLHPPHNTFPTRETTVRGHGHTPVQNRKASIARYGQAKIRCIAPPTGAWRRR